MWFHVSARTYQNSRLCGVVAHQQKSSAQSTGLGGGKVLVGRGKCPVVCGLNPNLIALLPSPLVRSAGVDPEVGEGIGVIHGHPGGGEGEGTQELWWIHGKKHAVALI